MRIAFTHALCWPEVRRGGERFIQMLGAALVRRGHEVTILSSAYDANTTELDGVVTKRLPRRHDDVLHHERDFARKVFPHLVRDEFDAVHSMGRWDSLASIAAAKVRRDRVTVFTDLGAPDKRWYREEVSRTDEWVVHRVANNIGVYSCMSYWALDHLVRDYGRTDGVVVPGGVSLEDFAPADEREPAPTLLFSGAFEEVRKGVPVLLEALPLVAEQEPDVQFWLSGPGDPSDMLRAAPPEAVARTEFLGVGESDRQHERYGRAWATCLPSVHDSFGMVLVESLACGTPIVVTTNGAPANIVDPGVTGTICVPKDPVSLAAAIVDALALVRQPDTATNCRAAAAAYDWDTGLAPFCEALYRGESPPPLVARPVPVLTR